MAWALLVWLPCANGQDFGEDTYRTLAAADNAVMLVDAGKGLEPQTRKLFEVCRMRQLPVFTVFNKMDRPALEPLQLLDEIEKEFGLPTYPVNWPIGSGDRWGLGCAHLARPLLALPATWALWDSTATGAACVMLPPCLAAWWWA